MRRYISLVHEVDVRTGVHTAPPLSKLVGIYVV
jgi:hypothetical protein